MELLILHAIQQIHTPWLDAVMVFFTKLGDDGILWIALGVIMLLFKKTRKCGVCVLLSMLLCMLLGKVVLKDLIGRARPFMADPSVVLKVTPPGSFSFPSGHTLDAFTSATAISLCFRKPGIAAYVVASLIAFSRMYLFLHYPTDILGGILLGVCVAVFVAKMAEQIKKRIAGMRKTQAS